MPFHGPSFHRPSGLVSHLEALQQAPGAGVDHRDEAVEGAGNQAAPVRPHRHAAQRACRTKGFCVAVLPVIQDVVVEPKHTPCCVCHPKLCHLHAQQLFGQPQCNGACFDNVLGPQGRRRRPVPSRSSLVLLPSSRCRIVPTLHLAWGPRLWRSPLSVRPPAVPSARPTAARSRRWRPTQESLARVPPPGTTPSRCVPAAARRPPCVRRPIPAPAAEWDAGVLIGPPGEAGVSTCMLRLCHCAQSLAQLGSMLHGQLHAKAALPQQPTM